MEHIETDLLVIGWGKAGKSLAKALGSAGRDVVLVEQSDQMYGGGCINIACVPTKALVHQAELRRGESPAEWFASAVGKRDALTDKLRAANHAMLENVDAVTLVDGRARFVGAREVEVSAGSDVLRISASTVVINTGTVPARPDLPGADGARVHDSRTIQHVDPLPQRLAVVGGGFIGMEFAGMFARFGSEVTLLDGADRLLPGEDTDVAEAVAAALADAGVEVIHGARAQEIVDHGDSVSVAYASGSVDADAVLLATGRRPATDGLDLAAAGVDVDERGYVVVDDQLRTSADGVFAVGDVNGGPQFTYISFDDHRIVLDQLAGTGTRRTTDRVAVPTTTFITPPLSRVGLSETEARAQGLDVHVVVKPVAEIAAMPRPKILGETHGLIKLVVDADTGLLLGATLFCVDSQELVNLVALAMRAGVRASDLRDSIWTHPSSTEALNEVLAGLPR
ncbi:pyruvate/2-oxoglutarate dehydrogenase complex dihydrolipoamide dehydrogenase (E3) component [Nocardioides albertanoniae]|uniref:Pyruvate/2-oxoglutarate dehydrogenase complex dihydrolipoamide dehydrogenase (E3) component n=1 Tax=Nocardioides albertanoniae TaxID=1175486 RepID=A0A543A119_9ACTN|nr:FAD-dependent oxidoreductase [Nocardioides albertanoniae]TQL66292.1 pyruvate/2-oxoglutarate dehydrogenase complex dihydrolipoamide dehydrogenase (E3) component [Nocardioides albertanoniae]